MNDPLPITPISPLRQRLIDDMNMRRFSLETQRNYIRDVGRFAVIRRAKFQCRLTIGTHVTAHDAHLVFATDLLQQVSEPQPDLVSEDRIAVLRLPDEVVLDLQDCMGPTRIAIFSKDLHVRSLAFKAASELVL